MVTQGCPVCGRNPCPVVVPPPPPAFSVVALGDRRLFNIPSILNWNWYSIDRQGWWCWEDLWHAGNPALVPFDRSRFYWGCHGYGYFVDECERVWKDDEMAPLVPGYPSSAPECDGCGTPHAWPFPMEVAHVC